MPPSRSLRRLLPALLGLLLAPALAAYGATPPPPSATPRVAPTATPPPDLVILFTGQTDAALYPCDCPLEPDGGLARRATAVEAARRELAARGRPRAAVLLLDCGNLFGGGLTDQNTAGSARDRERTETELAACARLGYDAAGIGESEFALGEEFLGEKIRAGRAATADAPALRLLSANLVRRGTTEPAAGPSLLLERAGRKIGLVGLTPPEAGRLYALRGLELADPVAAARAEGARLRAAGAELVVALAPLGEAATKRLIAEAPELDVILFGGRRQGHGQLLDCPPGRVAAYGVPEGKQLGRLEVRWSAGAGGGRPSFSVSYRRMSAEIIDEPGMRDFLAAREAAARGAPRVRLELYRTPLDPAGAKLAALVARLAREAPGLVEATEFIAVELDADGKPVSPLGAGDLEEARRRAIIRRDFPEQYPAYVARRDALLAAGAAGPAAEAADWSADARALGIVPARVRAALAAGEADALLVAEAERARLAEVARAPALLVNRRLYVGQPGYPEDLRLLAVVCGAAGKAPGGLERLGAAERELCRKVPRCFDDADCQADPRRRGEVGRCLEAGAPEARCEYSRDPLVRLTILADRLAVHGEADAVLAELTALLPGLGAPPAGENYVRLVDWRTAEGRALAARNGLGELPAFILDAAVRGAARWAVLAPKVSEVPDGLLLDPAFARAHQLITRLEQPGRLEVFARPRTAQGLAALLTVLEAAAENDPPPELVLRYVATVEPAASPEGSEPRLAAPGGAAELEESLRQLALLCLEGARGGEAETKPARPGARFLAYLKERQRAPDSSYWEEPLRAAGYDPAEVRRLADEPATRALLEADARRLAELQTSGESVFLAENQELVPVGSPRELRRLVEAVADRLGEAPATPLPAATPRP